MRSNLFYLLGFLFCSLTVYGQSRQEFESETFPPENWTIYHLLGQAGNLNGWTRQLQPKTGIAGEKNYVAYSLNGSYMDDTDSWLVTPQTTIKENDQLSFMLKITGAGPATADTLDILLSVTGNAKKDFTTSLLRITPRNAVPWSHYCIDLSAFAGKQVYIAFRDHLMQPGSYTSGCNIYLDDVEVTDRPLTDLSLSSVVSPANDCSTIQYAELSVLNTGKTIHEFTACYQVNDGEIEKEVISGTIESNGSRKITFQSPIEFQPNSKNKFKAWIECQEDGNQLNDTLFKEVHIGSQIPFPYDMAGSATVDSDFTSFGFMSAWNCLETGITTGKTWIYGGASEGAALGSNCIHLPKGKIKLSFTYLCSQHSVIKVANASYPGFTSYTNILGESPLLLGNGQINSGSFAVDIPEEGLQSLAFYVSDPNNGSSPIQFILGDLRIETLLEDLGIDEIQEPYGTSLAASETGKEIQIKITNKGSTDQTDFKLCYRVDNGETVAETYTKTLKPGESDTYSFDRKYKFNQKRPYLLKTWLESDNDTNVSNDSIERTVHVYQSPVMPYKMSFEKAEAIENWIFVNANQDAVEWKLADLQFKGDRIAYLPFIENVPNDDYLISPAIQLPAGKARISFFYTLNGFGSQQLKVFMGKTNRPETFETVLLTLTETTGDWVSGYAPLEIEEAGTYYFAMHGSGTNGEIGLDDIRIDTETDACMKSLSFEEKGNYNLTESAVKIAFGNHSATTIQEAKVSYQLNNNDPVSEIIKREIKPGEVIEYTFGQKADLSSVGTHRLNGWVEVKGDVEEFNNSMSATHDHYKNKQIPYFQNFEDETARRRWNSSVMDLNGDRNSWIPAGNASFSAYSGTTCLYYDSSFAGDDWIFSECIEIPAGEFECSFFYRTYKNLEDRKENFKIMLGTSPEPEAMTIEMANFRQISAADPLEHVKVIRRFKMEKPGKYYIGVYTDSPASQGMIVIDDIELKRYEERPPFYLSDFTNHFDDWTAYKLYPNTFDQWTKTTEEGKENDIVQLKTFKVYAPGIFVSPGFRIEKGQPIDLEMEYALLTSNENDRFGLYMGNENHPDSLTRLIAELPATSGWESYSKQITATETGRYFFAVKAQRAATDKDVYYKLGAFKLTPAGLNEYELKGTLTDTAGNPIQEAEVKLTGGQSQHTLTDRDGMFLFGKVMEQQDFTLEITKDRFFPHTQTVKLEGASKNLGTLVLRYELLPPTGVSASVNPGNQVELEWRAPGSITEFRYDDGTSFGQVGFNSGTASDVMGNVFRTPALLQEISWYTNPTPMIHDKVNVYLLDLDSEGNPTNSILYEATDVPAKDSEWCSHRLTRPVNAPNGFLVAISYNNGSLGLAIDDGIDDYAFQNNTCFIGNLLTGTFSTFESQGGKSSFLLRAKGIPANTVSSQALFEKAGAKTISYQVYRFEKANEHNQANWILLTPQPTVRTNFKEEVSALNGTYRYAVKALYPSKEVSEAAISNEITVINDGIAGGNETVGVHIWPVPAKESVTVNSDSPVVRYIIRNPLGIVVASEQIDQKDFVIPLGKLRAGHYLISLYTEDGKVERKIIKQ